MTFQPTFAAGNVPFPLPQPRRTVQHLMLAAAIAADQPVNCEPNLQNPLLKNCFVLEPSKIILAGTACRRPLLLREFGALCDEIESEGVIVRLGDDLNAARATFDIKLRHSQKLQCRMQLWVGEPQASTWLIPTAGEPTYLQFSDQGFVMSDQAPYHSDVQCRRGLQKAAAFLSVANAGWF